MTELMNNERPERATYDAGRAYELDRAHVFHSWSAQAEITPMVVTRAEGSHVWDARRQALPRLQLAAGLHQPRPPAPPHRGRDPGAGRPPLHDRARGRQRRPLRGRAPHREPHPRRPRPRLLHQRRRRRQRARRTHGAAAHRPPQGADDLPQLSRRHPPRGQHDRRPAPVGQRPRLDRHGPLLRPVPLPQRLPRDHRGRGVPARARAPRAGRRARGPVDHRRDRARGDPRHRRDHGAAAGLPRRRAGDLRPPRHHAHRRRGDVGLRPRRPVVRGRARVETAASRPT